MPRALAIRHLSVAGDERGAYLARLAERVASARACGYNCWAFERDGEPGRFVEFIEAGDRGALDTALTQDALHGEALDWRRAPVGAGVEPAIYLEVRV